MEYGELELLVNFTIQSSRFHSTHMNYWAIEKEHKTKTAKNQNNIQTLFLKDL